MAMTKPISTQVTYTPAGTGAVATTVQSKLREWVSVKDFGAVGDGVTSDVAAVNAAITYANAASGSVTIFFPSGSYNLKAGVTQVVTKDDVSFVGENARIEAETGKIFVYNSGSLIYRSAIKGFFFNYPSVTTDANAVPISLTKCLYFKVQQIRVFYAPAVLYIDEGSNGVVDDVAGLTANVAKNAIHLNSCVVTTLDNVHLINNAGLQPIDPATPYPDPPVAGNVFIRVTGQTTDTLHFKSGVLCNRYRRGFYATCGLTQVLLNVWLDSCVFDYCYDKGVFIENLGSSVSNINMKDLYIQAMQGIGLHISAAGGLTNRVTIVRPLILLSGVHSLLIDSTDPTVCTNVLIEEPFIVGGNRTNASGIDVFVSKARVRMTGGKVGMSALPTVGLALQANFGVYFDACDQYTVTGVEAGGVLASFEFATNPATNYRARSVFDNKTIVGFSPSTKPEYESTSLAAVVSGDTYTNNTPYKEYVSIYGVSASGAATIEVNGQQYSTRSEWSGLLNPGDTLKVTTGISCNRRKTRLP